MHSFFGCGDLPEIIHNDSGLYEGNLESYFRAFFHHARSLNNPYHNFRHPCHVLWLCHKACRYYVRRLSKKSIRNLHIAALFHDFDHTGKAGSDAINIERAIAGLRKYASVEDLDALPNIEHLIEVTEYPYTIPSSELDLPGLIIRDADMLQAFDPAWIQQVIFGLAEEWGKSPLEILTMQEKFLGNLSFHTAWARKRFPKTRIDAKILEAKKLLSILKV